MFSISVAKMMMFKRLFLIAALVAGASAADCTLMKAVKGKNCYGDANYKVNGVVDVSDACSPSNK